jgi:hypothetical protein
MRTSAAPFASAATESVRFKVPWQLHTLSGPTPLLDEVPAWDYQTTIALSAVLEVDADAVRETCHLGASSKLCIIVSAASSTTKMRGPVAVAPVSAGPVDVDIQLRGHELGGRLILDTMLLAAAIERTDALSPHAAGSILWRQRKTSWLEGESARFPTEVANLAAPPFFAPKALWFVDVRTDDLDSAALGAVRLILNENHQAIARLLAGDTSPETRATLSTLRWDVSRQLILAALDCDDFVECDGHFDDETLGQMLAGILTLYWPGESPRVLRQLRRTDPARFERELQDRAGLLDD